MVESGGTVAARRRGRRGDALVELVLLLSLVVLVVIASLGFFGVGLKDVYDRTNREVDDAVDGGGIRVEYEEPADSARLGADP